MRCFAEEKKTGTLEILITQPISIFQIILSKFFAASFLAILTILPTLIYYISVSQMGEVLGNIDHPTTNWRLSWTYFTKHHLCCNWCFSFQSF